MADGMREKTTNVGGVIKRIWYALNGTTQTAELMSIDDTGNFKCVSEQIMGLAGTGNRMVVADANGNMSAGYGITDVAIQGTAYNRIDVNIAVIQGVPQGGAKYLGGGNQTGAIKIKLPIAKQNTMFKFRIKINGYSTGGKQSNAEYIVKGYNQAGGFGSNYDGQTNCQVTVVKDNLSTMTPVFYFCTGATEDYILIGEITDIHVSKAVVIDDVEAHYNYISVWDSGWAISLVTTLETLTSQYKVAVTPSLNATHLNGVQEATTSTANTIVKRDANGVITNSQYKLSALNTAPASSTATGTLGEIRIDANYIYVCIATNTWKRTALTTW